MPTHPANPVFPLSQAADILDMTQSRLKNWTNGKPLKISPSISAHGTGSRNLYDMSDLYRLAIAAQLNRDGFAARSIQMILDQLGTELAASKFALVTSGDGHAQSKKGSQLHVQVITPEQSEPEGWRAIHRTLGRSFGCYLLNILRITETVDDSAQRYVNRSVGIYRSGEKTPAKEEPEPLRRTRKYKLEE